MRVEVHHYIHSVNDGALLSAVRSINQKVDTMLLEIQTLVDKVAEQTSVISGLNTIVDTVGVTLVDLKAALDAALASGNALTPAELATVNAAIEAANANIAAIQSNVQELADAVAVNTPAN